MSYVVKSCAVNRAADRRLCFGICRFSHEAALFAIFIGKNGKTFRHRLLPMHLVLYRVHYANMSKQYTAIFHG